MFMLKSLIVGVAALSFPVAALAETYVCDIKDAGRHNTIPEKVIIELGKDGQSAMVTDNFLYYYKQAPKAASFVRNTSKNLRVRWTVEDAQFSGGGQSDLKFSLVHKKSNNKAFVTLNIPSYDNMDSGTGTCAIEK